MITEKEPINKVIGIFGEVLVDVFPDASVLGGARLMWPDTSKHLVCTQYLLRVLAKTITGDFF